jgi:hypothetical protein
VLILVGLLQPLVPLFVKNFTRTVELLCDGQNFPDHWAITMNVPLEVCIRKNMYTWEMGAGLGWVVTASGSVTCP